MFRNLKQLFLAALMVLGITFFIPANQTTAFAADNYPIQQMNITNSKGYNLNSTGNGEEAAINVISSSEKSNERWKLVYVSDGCYKLVNMANGKILSPKNFAVAKGTACVTYGEYNRKEQYWNITGVDKDVLGNYLTYKITNSANSNIALTFNSNNTVSLAEYSNSDSQKWRLNSAGLQGFAGASTDMNGHKKASNIGGVLGKTVYVTKLADLIKYAAGDDPRTIVISNSLSVAIPSDFQHKDSDEKKLTKIIVGKNKTIVGAYGVSLKNIYFYLDQTSNSGNFIFKNITIKHDEELNLNNFIPMYISQGQNFWLDHVTFEGHASYSNADSAHTIHENNNHPVDKFLYVGVKADYVTISDSKFGNHEYGLILGYPNESSEQVKATYTGYPRMTLNNNYFNQIYCRAPGLMRYGNYHSFNNYVENVHLGYTAYTNANIYSESNSFKNVAAIVDDKKCAGFTDVNSIGNVQLKLSSPTSWNPAKNYKYTTLNANDVANYCKNYSGAQSSAGNFKYANFK